MNKGYEEIVDTIPKDLESYMGGEVEASMTNNGGP